MVVRLDPGFVARLLAGSLGGVSSALSDPAFCMRVGVGYSDLSYSTICSHCYGAAPTAPRSRSEYTETAETETATSESANELGSRSEHCC